MMDNYGLFEEEETMDSLFSSLDSHMLHSTATSLSSQIGAEVEQSVKRVIEASIRPGLIEETLRKTLEETLRETLDSIPTLVEGEMKKQFQVIPGLVKEAVQDQLRAIPELILSVIKEGQILTSSVPPYPPFLQNFAPPSTSRSFPQQPESSKSRILHLKFEGNLPKETFTKENLKDQGASLSVVLRDQSGNKVDFGPESRAKINISVVDGDLKVKDGLSEEDISKHVVLPREGKPPLLKKEKYVMSLCHGVANVGEIVFTDNSKSMRNGKFRLAAQVLEGILPGVAIKGAVSDDFPVKEYRNTFNRKRETLSLHDEVWHLVNIGRGKIYKKLEEKRVYSVKDLLQLHNNDPKELLQIFHGNKKNLKKTIDMAMSCSQPGQTIQSQDMAEIVDNSQKELGWENSFGGIEDMFDLHLPGTSADMYLNDIGADQGVTPYQGGEDTLPGYCFTPSPEFGALIFSEMRSYCPKWRIFRAVLRFNIAIKTSVKEGPRAGKRQKFG